MAKSKSPNLIFGKALEVKQREMKDKLEQRAAAKKAAYDLKMAPRRLKRIRANERRIYAENRTADLATIKANEKAEREAKKLLRAQRRADRAQALFMEQQRGTFKAIGLDTEAEQDAYMTVRDLLPPVLVSRLAQGNFIAADKVSEAIEYLRTVGAAQLV